MDFLSEGFKSLFIGKPVGPLVICLLDGILLLEHSSVNQFMPLLTICSMMPSRVDADVEGLNIFGNSSQPSFSGTSSWSSPCGGWVAHCSYQDSGDLPWLCNHPYPSFISSLTQSNPIRFGGF